MKNVSLVSYSVITVKLTLVLTFDFAIGKHQREHPHKLSDKLLKSEDSGDSDPHCPAAGRQL